MGRTIAIAAKQVYRTNTRVSIPNMHTPVDTCIDTIDMDVYMTFDYDDTLLNAARHIDFQ